MQVKIFDRVDNGLPGTTVVDEPDVQGVQFTHGALWGPTSARFDVGGTLEDAFRYADQYLGNMVQIWSPHDNQQVWEGYIWSVSFGYGTRMRTRSLDSYANLVRVHFTEIDPDTSPPTEIGKATPVTASASAGQAARGVIEYNHTAGSITTTEASDIAAAELSKRRRIYYTPATGGGDRGAIQVECVGFYRTLFYQSYTANTTGTADVSTVIQNILTAECPFISTDYTLMATTSKNVKRWHQKYELAGEIIKRLITKVSNYTFRIDYGRIPVLETNRRDNTTPTYYENTTGEIETRNGQVVEPWMVRPDSVLLQRDFVPPTAILDSAIESVESIYIMETTYNAESNTVSWRPAIAGIDGELEG